MTSPGGEFDCVVDASVGLKLFVVEPLAARADVLFAHLGDAPPARLYGLDLFMIECTNILWKYVRRFGYAASSAQADVLALVAIPLQVVPTLTLAAAALQLAVVHGSSAYDAAYVALAQDLTLPLVTADDELVRRFGRTAVDIRHLADWPA